ncbi:MAG: signal peptidase I [Erysipelotrichaceae bacterium]|nr:signal peptidase I [Erysipelotrichaceae bacterium]
MEKDQNLTLGSASKIIRDRKEDARIKRGFVNAGGRILLVAFIVWMMLTQVFVITRAEGNGMFPFIKDGDLVIGYRLSGRLCKGDVVLYEQEGSQYLGRIMAQKNDLVTVDDTGTFKSNGMGAGQEALYPTYPQGDLEYPLKVGESEVFVLGDFRTRTRDSRNFGPIPFANVKAKVISVFRRQGI